MMRITFHLEAADIRLAIEDHVRRHTSMANSMTCTVRLTHTPAEQDGIHRQAEDWGAEVAFVHEDDLPTST